MVLWSAMKRTISSKPRRSRVGIAKTAYTAVVPAEQQPLALPGEGGTAALVKRLAHRLLDLQREINDIDKTITERFRDHPCARIIESLPGFGPHLGAEFLVVTGGDLASFATPGLLAAYAGLVPTPRDSGRVVGNLRRPKRYNRRLRRVLYMAALSSIRADGPSRQSSTPQTRRATHPYQALLALARRLVDVLWALLRDGREFGPHRPMLATAAA